MAVVRELPMVAQTAGQMVNMWAAKWVVMRAALKAA